jgi:hypothetical protein
MDFRAIAQTIKENKTMLKTYQFVSLHSPCQIDQNDNLESTEKLRWVKEGFEWSWHDNKNWWAYELTYDPNVVVDNTELGINDVIYGYGFESYTGQDEAKQWGDEMEKNMRSPHNP